MTLLNLKAGTPVFYRRNLIKLAAVVTLSVAAFPTPVMAQEPIPVVATFSILGDMVKRIGGKEVVVTTLVGHNGDTHVYQPTPADAKAVKRARLLFTNGLQFEGWLERLAQAAAFDGETVVTTDGIELIALEHHDDDKHADDKHGDDKHADEKHGDDKHGDEKHAESKEKHGDDHDNEKHAGHDAHDHGEFDPHGWLSLRNAITYVENITAALSKAAPEKAATFYQNRAAYIAKIESLDKQIKDMIAPLPARARTIITSHDAFEYFARDYELVFLAPQGLSTESEASARDVAQLIKQIRADGIGAVFVENVADPRLLQQIATETSSRIGGKLYPGALSGDDGPAATYLELMRHNATTIVSALTQAK